MRVLIINNIPTPYRNFLYEKLSEVGIENNVEFTIAFQAEKGVTHKKKYEIWWTLDDLDFNFKYFFSKNIFGRRLKYHSRWSINIDLILHILLTKYDVILAPPSMSIFNWIYSIFPFRAYKVLYSETNAFASSTDDILINKIRRRLFLNFDAIAVPGKYASDWLYHICPGLKKKRVLHLPNIIDYNAFNLDKYKYKSKKDLKKLYSLPADKVIITGIGIAKYKGKRKLIESIKKVEGNYLLLIIGGGELFQEHEKLIKEFKLESKVILLGNKREDDVRNYLFLSDWFIHPSLFDPSPLVLVEAAFMGLPIAATVQTGNTPELVKENKNGYLFNYHDNFESVLKKMINTPQLELKMMGRKSLDLAYRNFDANLICKKFVSSLKELNK